MHFLNILFALLSYKVGATATPVSKTTKLILVLPCPPDGIPSTRAAIRSSGYSGPFFGENKNINLSSFITCKICATLTCSSPVCFTAPSYFIPSQISAIVSAPDLKVKGILSLDMRARQADTKVHCLCRIWPTTSNPKFYRISNMAQQYRCTSCKLKSPCFCPT
jgi:hypothetical protein